MTLVSRRRPTFRIARFAAPMVLVFAGSPGVAAQERVVPPDALTNEAVVEMVVGKLPKDLILAKIQTAKPAFDLSAAGLVFLSQNKVPESVVTAMMKSAAATSNTDASDGSGELLTNDAVVSMVVGQVPKSIVLRKIQTTPNAFDLSATGLVALNNNKVPKDVIKAMMSPEPPPEAAPAPQSGQTPSSSARQPAATPPPAEVRTPRKAVTPDRVPAEPGIHVYADEGDGLRFQQLEPAAYTAQKTGGWLASQVTGGIAKQKWKAVVRGAEASVRTVDASAEFYFVFEQKAASLSNNNAWMATLSSPNEFSLVRLDVKKSTRELVVAAGNAFGYQAGTEDRANVPFTFVKLAPGVYRVIPDGPLGEGQYAFLSAAGAAPGASGKIFDFGVTN
jgi:hypothetical protein